jgi:uncharacterized protein (TIGR02001 family)
MKLKQILAGATAALASSGALAGSLSGNVGAVSDYMFRGVDQTAGAAVQGGVDYGFDFGLYTGLWVSNSLAGGGNEADAYAGYGLKLGPVDLDGGIIYYGYTEDTEAAGVSNGDYAELYVGGGFGPFVLKAFYAPEFGGDTPAGSAGPNGSGDLEKNELLYVTSSVTLSLNETLSFIPQVGFTTGDGASDTPAFGDDYIDYSLTAVKQLEDELSVSLAVIGTDRDNLNGVADNKDNPKFVVGLKKTFNL